MRSPFPGMDPFIENQEWKDFHSRAITLISGQLGPQIEPSYVARIERRVYVETEPEERERFRDADVAVVMEDSGSPSGTSASATIAPVESIIPTPDEQREAYLEIRDPHSRDVITVIDLLSPTNKRAGSRGHKVYLDKRNDIVQTRTNLVEIDLLRGGVRLPSRTPLPAGDYFAVVSKGYQPPRAWTYAWPLEHRLPIIPVPLRRGEDDALVDLQAVHDAVYERGRYHISLDYRLPLTPPLTEAQTKWAAELLSSRRGE